MKKAYFSWRTTIAILIIFFIVGSVSAYTNTTTYINGTAVNATDGLYLGFGETVASQPAYIYWNSTFGIGGPPTSGVVHDVCLKITGSQNDTWWNYTNHTYRGRYYIDTNYSTLVSVDMEFTPTGPISSTPTCQAIGAQTNLTVGDLVYNITYIIPAGFDEILALPGQHYLNRFAVNFTTIDKNGISYIARSSDLVPLSILMNLYNVSSWIRYTDYYLISSSVGQWTMEWWSTGVPFNATENYVTVNIWDGTNYAALGGSTISIINTTSYSGNITNLTPDGSYSTYLLLNNTFNIGATKSGYAGDNTTLNNLVYDPSGIDIDIYLYPYLNDTLNGTATFIVRNSLFEPVSGVSITGAGMTKTTGSSGTASFTVNRTDTNTFLLSKIGYTSESRDVTLGGSTSKTVYITMNPGAIPTATLTPTTTITTIPTPPGGGAGLSPSARYATMESIRQGAELVPSIFLLFLVLLIISAVKKV